MTKIYEANNHILIHAGYADPVEHCHMAAHVIISVDGEMRVISNGTAYLCRGAVIPSGVPHQIETFEKNVLVFLYDSTTGVAKQIKEIRCIGEESCRSIVDQYAIVDQYPTAEAYHRFEQDMLAQLELLSEAPCLRDERITAAMQYIQMQYSEKISCRQVADAVHLSQGRFSHLFKEHAGMTFAAYLIYQRIMSVYAAVFRGCSITEAALEAGFSSSAHFADVNRRVFGISASSITNDWVFKKVI